MFSNKFVHYKNNGEIFVTYNYNFYQIRRILFREFPLLKYFTRSEQNQKETDLGNHRFKAFKG